MAAAMVMAKAIKMRIAFPSFLLSTTEKRELPAAVAWNTKQTGAVAAQPQHCFESPVNWHVPVRARNRTLDENYAS
jgi:hypothetical protein